MCWLLPQVIFSTIFFFLKNFQRCFYDTITGALCLWQPCRQWKSSATSVPLACACGGHLEISTVKVFGSERPTLGEQREVCTHRHLLLLELDGAAGLSLLNLVWIDGPRMLQRPGSFSTCLLFFQKLTPSATPFSTAPQRLSFESGMPEPSSRTGMCCSSISSSKRPTLKLNKLSTLSQCSPHLTPLFDKYSVADNAFLRKSAFDFFKVELDAVHLTVINTQICVDYLFYRLCDICINFVLNWNGVCNILSRCNNQTVSLEEFCGKARQPWEGWICALASLKITICIQLLLF